MSEVQSIFRSARVLIFGLVAVIVVLGAALIIMAIGRSGTPVTSEQIDALANSDNACVVCHRQTTPGIVEQYGHSSMADAEVACQQCHEVTSNYPGAEEHEGTYVLRSPTTAMCQKCHAQEVAQYYQSRHSLPAYVAVFGSSESLARSPGDVRGNSRRQLRPRQISQCHRRFGRARDDPFHLRSLS